MWNTISTYAGLIAVFFAALTVMHREFVKVIKNQMPETMPQQLQEEVVIAYRKINGEVFFCVFGASASLCAVLAMYLQWRGGNQMTFLMAFIVVFALYSFLLFMKFLTREKGKNFLQAYNRAIRLVQMSQLVGRVSNIQTRSLSSDTSVYITLDCSVRDIGKKDIGFVLSDYQRYSPLLIGHRIRVFFIGPDPEQNAIPEERQIQHIVSVDSEEK